MEGAMLCAIDYQLCNKTARFTGNEAYTAKQSYRHAWKPTPAAHLITA